MFEKNYRLQDIQLSKSLKYSRLVAAAFQYNSLFVARQPRPREPKAGGEYRARTGDLLVANQALSQLS